MHELDLHSAHALASFLDSAPNFGEKCDWRRLRLRENKYLVHGHTFLGDQDLLRAIDDEVAALNKQLSGSREIGIQGLRFLPDRKDTRLGHMSHALKDHAVCRTESEP